MKKKSSGIPTLQDVAARAGVSVSTASRILSNSSYPVSREMRKRVILAARELQYMPNQLGRLLKGSISPAIGIIVPTLQNPFFSQVILGAESAARNLNYEIVIFSSHRKVEQERRNILTLLQNRVMSLILTSIDTNSNALRNYIDCGGQVALLESEFRLDGAISMEDNYLEAGRIATQHLLDMGHRNIAFLTSPLTKNYRRKILVGVEQILRQTGVAFSDEDVFVADTEIESDTGLYEFEVGKRLARDLLQSRRQYSAIIAINDLTAFGVIQALTQNGITVPERISVIGFDNITYAEMISPPLTTVELSSGKIGYIACKMLMDSHSSDTDTVPGMTFRFPCLLRQRQSVKAIGE